MERAAAADAAYPLVLLDATMPDVDGFAVAEQIQRRPALAGAAIMMLTSGGRSGDGARCHALGVTTHVTKPITQSDLLDAILIAVGQRSPHSELRSLPADGGGADARTDTSAATTRAAVPLHVLLAEDNVVNQRLAVRILEKRGHTVSVAATGTQAVAAFEREPFDVVLMDVQMPEMDGLEATAEIRRRERAPRDASPRDEALHEERERRPHIPIIAMTAHAMKGDEGRCLAAGMDGYICKPIDAQRLLSVIATLVTPGGPTAPPTEDATNIANTDDAAEGAAR
jgi:two-component system sensor histidine kinase/response regulator